MAEEAESGRFTQVVPRPDATLARGADVLVARALHEYAHRPCFIARSVNFPVIREPRFVRTD